MTTLTETLSLKGTTIETVANYAQQYIDEHYEEVLSQHWSELEEIRARFGEATYARYSQELFRPLYEEFKQAGLTGDPATLPGTFPLSREQWGPEDERERRFWCVLHDESGKALGTLVTRFFHDHTRLRIPHPPTMVALAQTNQTLVAQLIERSDLPTL